MTSSGGDGPRREGGPVVGTGLAPFVIAEHNCFACGSLNEHGMKLVLHVERGRSWTEVTLPERFEGWAGMAHGGILATILDEVMAWALVGDDNWGLTARMTVSFRRPVGVGRLIRATGEVVRSRRRLVDTVGRIVDAETGEELATASGTYMAADPARRRALQEQYAFRLARGDAEGTPEEERAVEHRGRQRVQGRAMPVGTP